MDKDLKIKRLEDQIDHLKKLNFPNWFEKESYLWWISNFSRKKISSCKRLGRKIY